MRLSLHSYRIDFSLLETKNFQQLSFKFRTDSRDNIWSNGSDSRRFRKYPRVGQLFKVRAHLCVDYKTHKVVCLCETSKNNHLWVLSGCLCSLNKICDLKTNLKEKSLSNDCVTLKILYSRRINSPSWLDRYSTSKVTIDL